MTGFEVMSRCLNRTIQWARRSRGWPRNSLHNFRSRLTLKPLPITQARLVVTVGREEWLEGQLLALLETSFTTEVRVVGDPSSVGGFASKWRILLQESLFLLQLLGTPRYYAGRVRFVCLGGHYAVLAFARICRPWVHHEVFLSNFYIHALGSSRMFSAILQLLLNGSVRVATQSSADNAYFAKFLPAANITKIPIALDRPSIRSVPAVAPGYFFSGGWTNRDYRLLFEAAGELPEERFVVVRSLKTKTPALTSNIADFTDLPAADFHGLMAGSKGVIVPLLKDVGSSGQMVVLAAMSMGKPIVIAGVGAITDYVEDGKSALYYELGNRASLVDKLRLLISDPSLGERLGSSALVAHRQYTTVERNKRLGEFFISAEL